MRVSTAQIYSGGIGGIQNLQSNLYTLQNQVSTGRKIVTPKDDPVGAAQALLVGQSLSVNALYINNQEAAASKLSALDSVLGGVNDELQNIYENAVAAGNGAYSDSDRAAIAVELQERLKSLISLANSQDGTGRYIFAGFQSTAAPFTQNAASPSPYSLSQPYIDYNGDDGVQVLQVGDSQFVATNEVGSEVFMRVTDETGAVTGRSVFDAVKNLVDFLNTPGVSPADSQYLESLGDISSAIDTVSRSLASVGARESSLQNLSTMAEDRELQYKAQLSDLQDLDYAKALSDVAQKTIQLEAAQATFSSTAKLSLFNYL